MPDDVYQDGAPTIRRAWLLGEMFRVLQDAAEPLSGKQVTDRIQERAPLTPRELSVNNSGFRRAETFVRFASGWANAVGWISKSPAGWRITREGAAALEDAASDDELLRSIKLLYQVDFRRRQVARSTEEVSAKTKRVMAALDQVERGSWTAYSDLAALAGFGNQNVGTLMAETAHPNAHRVLNADGTIAQGFRWADPLRTDSVVDVLRGEGIVFDADGHASQAQRQTAFELEELLAEDAEPPQTRAWLVRGNNVNGKNLVPIWLQRGSCSIAASQIRSLALPLTRPQIVAVVEEDYAQKSYNTRNEKVTELDLFVNRLQVGDVVVTNDGAEFYVGEIAGDAVSVKSTDERSNLRRDVRWLNLGAPVDLNDLPAAVKPKLSSQHPIVDLTSDVAALRALVQRDEPTQMVAEKVAAPELRFPPATDELAASLLVSREWLQSSIDLLADRRQIIFYGPPGTGKTFLAQEIAKHLTDPAAVKLVQFHPAYSYEDFFEGYRPSPTADGHGTVGFTLTPGPFRRLVDAARENPGTPYILIIDEINRANLAKVFGELYFLLEYRDRSIDLLYSAGDEAGFTMPANVFIIGTMNTADRSIALVDAAMRRRFAFKALHPNVEPTKSMLSAWLSAHGRPQTTAAVLEHLNTLIKDEDFKIGPSYFMRESVYQDGGLAVTWETAILPLLEEHHFGDGTDVAKVYSLDRILRRIEAPVVAEAGFEESGTPIVEEQNE